MLDLLLQHEGAQEVGEVVGQAMAAVAASTDILERQIRQRAQAQRVIEFPKRQQPFETPASHGGRNRPAKLPLLLHPPRASPDRLKNTSIQLIYLHYYPQNVTIFFPYLGNRG